MQSITESRIAAFRDSLSLRAAIDAFLSAACLRLLNRPLNRRDETLESLLQQVVRRADVQASHGLLLDDRPRNEDHGHVRLARLRLLQGAHPVVAGEIVVGDDEIEGFARERGFETAFAVGQENAAGQAADFQPMANEFSVARAIFQMEESQPAGRGGGWHLARARRRRSRCADSAALR